MSQAAAISVSSQPAAGKARAAPAPPAAAPIAPAVLAVPAYLQARFKTQALVQRAPAAEPTTVEDEEVLPAGPGLQTKIAIGPPDDPYEQAADALADRVQRAAAPAPAVQRAPLPDEASLPIRRMARPDEDEPLPVQRKAGAPCPTCAAAGDRLQAKPAGNGPGPAATAPGPQAGRALHRALAQPGPGAPLSPTVRGRVEPALGADLGAVRVHADAGAAATRAIQARAFTHGQDIWLGAGESPNDLGLMAHEATHVVQQTGRVQRKPANNGAAGGAPARAGGAGAAGGAGGAAGAAAGVNAQTGGGTGAGGGATAAQPASAAGAVTPAGAGLAAPAAGGAGTGPTLLMPEPPAGLSAEEQARIAEAQGQASAAAEANAAMPPADAAVADARAAVDEPEAETAARAAGELTATLGERAAPSPEIEELCERIKGAIRRRRPPDEDALAQFDPGEATQAAGAELNSAVEGDAERVQGDYDQLNETPEGSPEQQAQPLETPPGAVETRPVEASQAVPDAVPAADLSLDADVAASSQRIEDAGMATAPAELITDPSNPVTQAREGQTGLAEAAARDPVEVMAEQTAIRDQAQGAMRTLQQQALNALQASRAATASGVGSGMVSLGDTEEQMRANAGAEAQRIFSEAQTQVSSLLDPLPQTAMQRWETGIRVLSTRVEQESEEFNRWKAERYSGVGGAVLGVVEGVVGMPDWAIRWLNGIEERFGNDVCDLVREISSEVNTVVATCEEIIDNANRQIAAVFAQLPTSLQDWAAGEQANFSAQLEGLRERAHNTRNDFNQQLSQQAAQAVQEVRERIHAMREEAQGLLGQIANAIERFAEDPAKFIIEGLLKLVGIAASAFWALVNRIGQVIEDIADDPMNFANNLVRAIGRGFQRFFDNFANHIVSGFFDWLFSGLGSVGVQLPTDFSLGSLITFFLQLMGITWARIRQILARHIGEQNVALLEKAYELIALLMERGVDGIYEMIREQLNPQTILDAILSAAVDFLIDALIRAVTPRIIGLFNPAGAIIQAIEVIYRVLAWIFNNAARIFSLVETVVNGAADLIAGNVGGMATAIEGALARLIAPVIDFLAGFLGLGNLPDRIADTIRGFQQMVLAAIERVVAFLAERARALLRTLGIGGGGEDDTEDELEGVQALASSAVRSRLAAGADEAEARGILRQIENDLRPNGLKSLELGTADAHGNIPIFAEASPKKLVNKLVDKNVTVALHATITMHEEEDLIPAGIANEGESLSFRFSELAAGGRRLGDDPSATERRQIFHGLGGTGRETPLPAVSQQARGRGWQPSAGLILEPRPGAPLTVLSWNTSQPKGSDNVSHAETQFLEWFDHRPLAWRRRVSRVQVVVEGRPICDRCLGFLQASKARFLSLPTPPSRSFDWRGPSSEEGDDKVLER
jgi:hypothetical protein